MIRGLGEAFRVRMAPVLRAGLGLRPVKVLFLDFSLLSRESSDKIGLGDGMPHFVGIVGKNVWYMMVLEWLW